MDGKLEGFRVVIVTGGRDYQDERKVRHILDLAAKKYGIPGIVQGGATGADAFAKKWCEDRGVPCFTAHAWWNYHGKSAGHRRNETMPMFFHVRYCIAFPGGAGTEGMVKICRRLDIDVKVPK